MISRGTPGEASAAGPGCPQPAPPRAWGAGAEGGPRGPRFLPACVPRVRPPAASPAVALRFPGLLLGLRGRQGLGGGGG